MSIPRDAIVIGAAEGGPEPLAGLLKEPSDRRVAKACRDIWMTADSKPPSRYYFLSGGREGTTFLGGSAMSRNAAVHRFEYDGWDVVIELDGSNLEGVSSGHADLHWENDRRCRIALTGRFKDAQSAIASLADRSRTFIDEWDIRRTERASPFIEG